MRFFYRCLRSAAAKFGQSSNAPMPPWPAKTPVEKNQARRAASGSNEAFHDALL
jgi:hypothetical protein